MLNNLPEPELLAVLSTVAAALEGDLSWYTTHKRSEPRDTFNHRAQDRLQQLAVHYDIGGAEDCRDQAAKVLRAAIVKATVA